MDGDNIRVHTEKVLADRLHEIADRPNHTVYQYTFDTADKTLSAEQQVALFNEMVVRFDGLCKLYPTFCDERLREYVLQSNPDLREFQRLYPKVFASCCVRAHGRDETVYLDKTRKGLLVALNERLSNHGNEQEQHMRVMATNMRLAMRPASELTPDSNAQTLRLDAHAQEQGVDPTTVTPLDPAELGESTVRQT